VSAGFGSGAQCVSGGRCTARLFVAALLGLATSIAAGALGSNAAAAPATGKERLSDKASDEQRVDDCKVPLARRTKARPVKCPWDAIS
jgi:hypothetical protein